ncbi:eukaryotic mitochondrial regulator protein-domain-containing protein [Lipomyces arxii]|uniref:mitochondrial 37S ribosomal protein mS45 n=1 Tax=Lipomyces arxii TaxID=56418 RepID=UPI0034CD9E30
MLAAIRKVRPFQERQLPVNGTFVPSRAATIGSKAYLTRRVPSLPGKTQPQSQMLNWLGPRALNGDYSTNPFCYAPRNHIPNYIPHSRSKAARDSELNRRRNRTGRDNFVANPNLDNTYRPFPLNPMTKTAHLLSNELKREIVTQRDRKRTPAQISTRLGIRKERVEAALRLADSEKEWRSQDKVTSDMERFADRMYRMMPITNGRFRIDVFNARDVRDVLDPTNEIVAHKRAGYTNMTLVDENYDDSPENAALQLGIKPAQTLLREELLREQEPTVTIAPNASREEITAAVKGLKGDNAIVKFRKKYVWVATPAKTGLVGYRYGAGRDHRRKYRKFKDNRLNI